MPRSFYAIDLLERSGRLAYRDLLRALGTVRLESFVEQFAHPLLVGSSLYVGEFVGAGGMDATMNFVFVDPDGTFAQQNTPDPSGLKRAIYPMLKNDHSTSAPFVFSIGRTSENDMVMADYAISRHHAELRIDKSHYYVKDLNTTNGCQHNGRQLEKGEEVELLTGDMITFGRFAFHLTPAHEVYDQLRGK